MRSRYSAFALGDEDYLLRTWHRGTRPRSLDLDPEQRWTGLEVLSTTGGGLLANAGSVRFRAHYRWRGGDGVLHEHSRFVREDGQWFYVDEI
ncbi:hypothetical protein GCM10010185_45440 [Saccharothrix coeruleofusca]|uniref:YchJ-like middle NTF2-like domain-containing protein n=2 Tax=Saccharothrix coeruleofusca TaxID=33919 RepID=A0A918ARU7_9PSEU|nr:hypothetical protein GCM10010185_45440 [Saccharothrix coeruleofusca]